MIDYLRIAKALVVAAVVAALSWKLYHTGYSASDAEARAEIAQLKENSAQAALRAEQDYSSKLSEAIQAGDANLKKANEKYADLSTQLLAQQRSNRARERNRDLERLLHDAALADCNASSPGQALRPRPTPSASNASDSPWLVERGSATPP